MLNPVVVEVTYTEAESGVQLLVAGVNETYGAYG
jgi:hypothetical protein